MLIDEEKILKFWEEKDIFKKSIKKRENGPFFSFYDGPPFATGKPHYGHILATTIKDAVLRYWTMKGYQVPRRVGWDCHGLPVENLIEKELNIKSKKEIEELGIEKFNKSCKKSVFRCVEDFVQVLKRVGRWADYSNSYATLDNDYIESVWWVLKSLWEKRLVYKNYRVTPYCPRCSTPLSNFEVNQGYKDTEDISVYVKFKILDSKEFEDANFLVWTTTPWTLPGNVALAINSKLDYCLVENNKEKLILAKDRIAVLEGEYEIIKEFKGNKLVSLKYEPVFEYLKNQDVENIEKAFCVLNAEFVSNEDGTGIVHIAPMYGEDDFLLSRENAMPFYHTVDECGCFKDFVEPFKGEFVKNSDEKIIDNLKERNLLYKEEKVVHSYPFCWRCDSPLLYYAIESWYIKVADIKDKLIENNKKIHWVPEHLKEGRFGKWIEDARDWGFSRNRFWGAPIPIWKCQDCGKEICIGSIEELKSLQKQEYNLKDLHRPFIDEVLLKCPSCSSDMKRVEEVFDCWFESGSMPYAQWHYPFENKELVEKTFPADFIAEGLDQTRGWFYTLHVLASALTLKGSDLGKNEPAFKNVIVNGLILDEKGVKLSKKLRNYPEATKIFDTYGADALRYFLLSSTSIGEDYRFSEQRVKEVARKVIASLKNCFVFFDTYQKNNFEKQKIESEMLLDKWIVSKTETLKGDVIKLMDDYQLTKASRLFSEFIEDFSNWYIRRSRRKMQKPETQEELKQTSQILYYTLFNLAKLMAPFTPFISEYIYQKLEGEEESVHLCDYPKQNKKLIDRKLEDKMDIIRKIVGEALAIRSKEGIKARQPLALLKIKQNKIEDELVELIKEEVNVKKVVFDKEIEDDLWLDISISEELKKEGILRDIIRHIQQLRKDFNYSPRDKILIEYKADRYIKEILLENKDYMLSEVLALSLKERELSEFNKEVKLNNKSFLFNIKKSEV